MKNWFQKKKVLIILGWLLLFLLLLYVFLGPVEQSFFGEVSTSAGSVKVGVNNESGITTTLIAYGFFGTIVLIVLIWSKRGRRR